MKWLFTVALLATLGMAPEVRAEPARTIHVVVALCDNENQGIAKVRESLGRGDDPDHNLYWGALYGVRNYFSRSKQWRRKECQRAPDPKRPEVLERCRFTHRVTGAELTADAYNGAAMDRALEAFLHVAAGHGPPTDLAVFIGHNGLMEWKIPPVRHRRGAKSPDAIVLACMSRDYFAPHLQTAGAHPLLWTTNLMAPEAYTLEAALEGWLRGESAQRVRRRAAKAYAKYQRSTERSALRTLVTGYRTR